MKTFVFVRGDDTAFRKKVVDTILNTLNPDINNINAIRISLSDYDQYNLKASDKSCKNLAKKILSGSHTERFIIIDNENSRPIHWQSYMKLAENIAIQAKSIGIDVLSENTNENNAIITQFKLDMTKYIQIKFNDDLNDIVKFFKLENGE